MIMRHLPSQEESDTMPQISMRMSRRKSDQDLGGSPPTDLTASGHPVKEGNVHAVNVVSGRRVRVPVVLKVYSSSFGRYAVVGQNKVICRECGFINLKNCTVRASSETGRQTKPTSQTSSPCSGEQFSFQLIPHNAEGQSLAFIVPSKSDLEQWLSVLDPGSNGDKDVGSVVTVGSPRRSVLGELCSLRGSSPRLAQKTVMPALEEE